MTRFLGRWLQQVWRLLSEAIMGRRLSFVLLAASLGAHVVCASWVATGGVAVEFHRELYLLLFASAALAVAMFAIRGVVRVRVAAIARAATVLIAIALLDGPPVFVPALLVAPLLIEPVLYDNDRIGMAVSGALFVAVLAVLSTRAPARPPASAQYLVGFALVAGLPVGLGWVAAFHRETGSRRCESWTQLAASPPYPASSSFVHEPDRSPAAHATARI